jgi:hypothetical protein
MPKGKGKMPPPFTKRDKGAKVTDKKQEMKRGATKRSESRY